MTTDQIRTKFLEFMKLKGHTIVPSAPVFLVDDKSTLFTSAGMQPVVPYLLGKPHPGGKRIANSQKCIRVNDIEEVGDHSHLTMFEMLGNWSLGDYFKDDSIAWSFEFLTSKEWLNLDPKKLYVTVYEGDAQVPRDDDAAEIWRVQFEKAGIVAEMGGRIQTRGADDNWWALGPTGPCGPDTEIFYYTGSELDPTFADTDEFIEIWNNVFMVYDRQGEGELRDLPAKNVDTGMGLERIAAVVQGKSTIFDTDLLQALVHKIFAVAEQDFVPVYRETDYELGRAGRIIADHLRSGVFMAADGVAPSNTERGYVMRRLLRRAVRQGLVLGIRSHLFEQLVPTVVELYGEAYPELQHHQTTIIDILNQTTIIDILSREEELFRRTLDKGVRELAKLAKNGLTGEVIFTLFDTYGFPPELSVEDALREGIGVSGDWQDEFNRLMDEQRQRSRTASVGEFKGGLADHEPATLRHHTATHLMYQALRQVLGKDVIQRGSNVNGERLRFDFSHDSKLTPEQKSAVESIVNEQIKKDLKVWFEEHPTDTAFKLGAKGAFGDKYGDTVKVYFMGKEGEPPYSIEICGGPHVERTGSLGHFRIVKEESSSAGVRRIKAKLEQEKTA